MKPQIHMVAFSGGKDSTAMLLRLLEEGRQVDQIVFCDTGMEFPQMYEHIAKVEDDIKREIIRVKPNHDFEYYLTKIEYERTKKSRFSMENGFKHKGYSWPHIHFRWCTGEIKNDPLSRYRSKLRAKHDIRQYVGFSAGEEYRLKRKKNISINKIYPLMEWGMTEKDCLAYCKARGYNWGGLYEKFTRVSCWCCPLQSLKDLRTLHKEFPELWEKLRKWDEMTWTKYKDGCSIKKLEQRFQLEEEWQREGKSIRSKAFFKTLAEM